jgi:translocator protein
MSKNKGKMNKKLNTDDIKSNKDKSKLNTAKRKNQIVENKIINNKNINSKINYIQLALCIALCVGIGFVSGQLTDTTSDWFLNLEKPSFYPPGYLFGIVWTILYIMMGISLYLVLQKTKDKTPYILFGSQLVLNFFWTLIFFGLKNIVFALIEIIAMWVLILLTIFSFKKYSKTAAYLLIPYLLWVTFATFLTLSIYLLN